jgi:universal stress protein A
VVAVDGEDGSVEVLRKAAALAPQAKLEVTHVIKPLLADHGSFIASMGQELSVEGIEGRMHEVVQNRLKDLAVKAHIEPAGIHVLQGTPSKEIKRLVRRLGADLVVMGCGEPAGSGWLIGSTTQNVLHGSSSDVLVIRGQQ